MFNESRPRLISPPLFGNRDIASASRTRALFEPVGAIPWCGDAAMLTGRVARTETGGVLMGDRLTGGFAAVRQVTLWMPQTIMNEMFAQEFQAALLLALSYALSMTRVWISLNASPVKMLIDFPSREYSNAMRPSTFCSSMAATLPKPSGKGIDAVVL